MSEDAQRFKDAAARIEKRMLTGQFGSTGIDLIEPRASDPNMRAVLGGFDAANSRNAVHGLMTGGQNLSLQQNNMQASDNGMGGSAGKGDEDKKRGDWDRLFLLQQQLLQRLAEIDQEIGDLRVKIADNEKAIERLDTEADQIKQLDAKLADHKSGKAPLKVGADGKLEDAQAEAALQAYEARTGRKVDRNNRAELDAAVDQVIQQNKLRLLEIEAERLRREGENDQYRKKIGDLETERTKADSALQKVNAAQQSKDPVALKEATAEASKVIVQEKKVEAVAANSSDADAFAELNDLNDLNSINVADASSLKPSAASEIDPQADTLRMRGNFNEQAQLQKIELAQVNVLTAKPVA